ncbi:PREDICTED: protein eyes shut homolog [Thamnophis sirtalis]|uniref:Protein eyes shut homolog n=1 Tax=Thamnophis sirtalis TaxID=35019 RepID=A0A6I9XP43_9SAUR|nr:PREDICTED: protein eyes shut homolog [Thamnophis sirtalis]
MRKSTWVHHETTEPESSESEEEDSYRMRSSRTKPAQKFNSQNSPCASCRGDHVQSSCHFRNTIATLTISDASFSNRKSSWMSFEPFNIRHKVHIRMQFQTFSGNGILFYAAQHLSSRSGDFLSITLASGYIQLRYNLGDRTVVLQTFQPVHSTNKTWLLIKAGRVGNEGYLDLDGINVTQKATSGMTSLDTQTDFYVGGLPSLNLVNPRGIKNEPTGFTGCIREVFVNGKELKLTEKGAKGGSNIGDCDGTPCGYRFTGNSYIKYTDPNYEGISERDLRFTRVSFNFTTSQMDGLLIWLGKAEDEDNDFLGVGLENGMLKVVVNLGERIAIPLIHQGKMACCKKWHFVDVVQNRTLVEVYLDEELALFEDLDPERKYTVLNYGGICYFGGFGLDRREVSHRQRTG